MTVLTVLGIGLASYLTYIHYAGIKPLCGTNGGGCEIVQTSQYSKLAGVPVALIGLLGYIAILGSLLAPKSETSRLATLAFTVVGFTILMGLAVWRFLRVEDQGSHEATGRGADLGSGEAPAPLGT
jgi:uncharacterized membrane protein